jgi:hypothetical protein
LDHEDAKIAKDAKHEGTKWRGSFFASFVLRGLRSLRAFVVRDFVVRRERVYGNQPEDELQLGRIEDAVRRSSPSDLKITDIRTAVVCSNYDYPIIRIDTNQDVYGIGEVRDAGHKENALQFKSMLLGQNPCNVDMIFRAIKRFGGPGRESGGVSGIELALWDLVGKVYGVPCWQFLGGKYREVVRIYADTPTPTEPTRRPTSSA